MAGKTDLIYIFVRTFSRVLKVTPFKKAIDHSIQWKTIILLVLFRESTGPFPHEYARPALGNL